MALARGLEYEETHLRLGAVTAPTLILWGGDDAWLPPSQAEGLAEHIPDARAEILAGCGHNLHEDGPEDAIPLIAAFLDTQHLITR